MGFQKNPLFIRGLLAPSAPPKIRTNKGKLTKLPGGFAVSCCVSRRQRFRLRFSPCQRPNIPLGHLPEVSYRRVIRPLHGMKPTSASAAPNVRE